MDDLISRSERLRKIRQTELDDYRSAMLISDAKKMIRTFIEEAPEVKAVPRSVFEQIKWERDCAMQQLKEHGIPFGGIAPAVDAREKLIELIKGALEHASKQCEELDSCCACPHGECGGCQSAFILDYLISNGVTFATDTNAGSKWIGVEPLGADDE